MIESFEAQIN
jgi:DNA-directed RNA polymerase II subunit RPB1